MFESQGRPTARQAVQHVIAHVPHLLSRTVIGKYSHTSETVIYDQEHIASTIGSILPGRLLDHGCMIVELPAVEVNEYGGRSAWIDLTGRQIGEIHTRGDGTIAGIPARLRLSDAVAVAAALLAIHQGSPPLADRRST